MNSIKFWGRLKVDSGGKIVWIKKYAVSYTVSRKEKFSDFSWSWTLLRERDSLLVRGGSATSPQSSVMSSTGSLCNTESATKSSYWFGAVLTASAYFGDVCAPVTAAPRRTNLRSATRGDLVISQTRTELGERSFRISAPTVWNSLPDSLKHFATNREHFRKELKTCLFRKAYAPASENCWRVNLLTYLYIIK